MKSQLELESKTELDSELDTNIYNMHIIKTSSKNSSSAPRPTFYASLPRPARVKHSPSCTGLSQTCALACFCLYVCMCVCACLCLLLCMCECACVSFCATNRFLLTLTLRCVELPFAASAAAPVPSSPFPSSSSSL